VSAFAQDVSWKGRTVKRTEQATAPAEQNTKRRPRGRIATVSVLAPMVAFGALVVSATGAEAASLNSWNVSDAVRVMTLAP